MFAKHQIGNLLPQIKFTFKHIHSKYMFLVEKIHLYLERVSFMVKI